MARLLFQTKNYQLNAIIGKARELTELNRVFKEQLDPILKPHCELGNWHHQTLVLMTTTSAWATQLRFQLPNLLKRLQKVEVFKSLKKIEIKIHTPS